MKTYGHRLTPEEVHWHVLEMNQRYPRGFRQPSLKNGPTSLTLVESTGLRAGLFPQVAPSRSNRKIRLEEARARANERAALNHLPLAERRAAWARIDQRLKDVELDA